MVLRGQLREITPPLTYMTWPSTYRTGPARNATANGLLPADTNPEDLAEFIGVVIQGMFQRARGGATQRQLELVANKSFDSLNFSKDLIG
ncbi:hypothetical protein QM716_17960 [Rhodococcus sp. IEGM 1409]|uniref:hypothetical protein n=1 Tax=Rhodococcus sp. IEGM 1409 TaxID=3047082 RepID=UPI0024B85CB4|nr:hypothetical protein [Rhodococcus sp. IEGM 1409]MDI9901742.1 hypothetical protein [Rhodococcus sp. IEGM 1409]